MRSVWQRVHRCAVPAAGGISDDGRSHR